MITTACNRKCPSCSFRIPHRKAQHWDVDFLMKLAPLIGHIPNLCITGGEPLLHPRLKEVVKAVSEGYSYDKIFLATNGDLILDHLDILDYFDAVRVPVLTSETHPGCKSNTHTIQELRHYCEGRVQLAEAKTVHWSAPGQDPRDCNNKYTTTICLDGFVYPCCVPLGKGLKLEDNPDWKEKIGDLPLHCDQCMLSSAKDVERAQGREKPVAPQAPRDL